MSVKIKLATNLPKPKPLSQKDIENINQESKKIVKAMDKKLKKLDLTSDDYSIIIK